MKRRGFAPGTFYLFNISLNEVLNQSSVWRTAEEYGKCHFRRPTIPALFLDMVSQSACSPAWMRAVLISSETCNDQVTVGRDIPS